MSNLTIHELSQMAKDEVAALGLFIGDRRVRSVTKTSSAYTIHLGSGDLISAKSHQRINEFSIPRQANSSDRIQRYGRFGSSI